MYVNQYLYKQFHSVLFNYVSNKVLTSSIPLMYLQSKSMKSKYPIEVQLFPFELTLRVWMRSLIVFRGSDIAANATGVWRSSDIEVKNSSWNLLMQLSILGGMEFFKLFSSCAPKTSSQSWRVCNQERN